MVSIAQARSALRKHWTGNLWDPDFIDHAPPHQVLAIWFNKIGQRAARPAGRVVCPRCGRRTTMSMNGKPYCSVCHDYAVSPL